MPVLDRPQQCQCVKVIGIFGEHYLDDQRYSSKTTRHNHCRNSHYSYFQTLGPLCGVIRDKDDVLLKPSSLAPNYTTARQGDFALAITGPNAQHAAADNTVTATPKLAPTPDNQEASTAALHTLKETLK